MITLPARPESLTFAPQQSALIVVDMQNAYASQGGYLDLAGFDVSATRPVIDNINTAVAAARAAGMLIIWFQNGWDDQYVEFGASSAIEAGIRSIIPASARLSSAESSPSPSTSTFSPLLFSMLMWICIPLPACSS
ncbi:amidohydrolase RutB in pyrimidine catabolism pathway [Klebsiella pneumoniae]|nr:amidohydrolase RutB in pyrimidine catabolism pathway [Klebsiella pneumoniae]STS65652.1 amidohydrolase RutB in pyrimidine catabolism pathway [Klebsiella pneumoniae]STS69664.1 amidohydrolase RutB in pyrimidine catabolism pathway [Klebsiella pneumoniae]